MRSHTVAVALILAASVGCNTEEKKAAELEKQQRDSAERLGLIRDKDNLGTAVAEYATMVNELDDVLRSSTGRLGGESIADDRQRRREVIRKARVLRQSLDSLETRIQQLETAARKSGAVSQSRLAEIAALKTTVAQLTQMSDRQTVEISRMTASFDSLSQVTRATETHAAVLQTALTENVERQESVFVAVGTSDELARRGIVRKRGGVIGIGKTLEPILPFKSDLFRPLRMSADTVIELPKASASYRVLTSQNPDGAKDTPLSRLTGKLVIHDPKLFWRDSRYLVIVER